MRGITSPLRVAARAGLTLQQLQQFVAGTVTLTNEQLRDLARRMGIPEACSNG
jgi:hypothetical protein